MLVDKCTKNISNRRQSTISQAAASQSKEGNHQQEKLRRLSYFCMVGHLGHGLIQSPTQTGPLLL